MMTEAIKPAPGRTHTVRTGRSRFWARGVGVPVQAGRRFETLNRWGVPEMQMVLATAGHIREEYRPQILHAIGAKVQEHHADVILKTTENRADSIEKRASAKIPSRLKVESATCHILDICVLVVFLDTSWQLRGNTGVHLNRLFG